MFHLYLFIQNPNCATTGGNYNDLDSNPFVLKRAKKSGLTYISTLKIPALILAILSDVPGYLKVHQRLRAGSAPS